VDSRRRASVQRGFNDRRRPADNGAVNKLAAGIATMTLLATPIALASGAEAAPRPKTYKNCTALQKVYPHGVGLRNAKDKTSGKPVRSFTKNAAVYKLNTKSDRDHDGIACEKA
jgi:hypothetical protein